MPGCNFLIPDCRKVQDAEGRERGSTQNCGYTPTGIIDILHPILTKYQLCLRVSDR